MRIRLLASALLVTTVVAAAPARYERLLGKSHFANKIDIEKFILNLMELNRLQSQINGEPDDVASDSYGGQSYLDAVGSEPPRRPYLLPYLFEGDIILTERQMNKTLAENRAHAQAKKLGRIPPVKRSLTSDTQDRWTFPVVYWIDTDTGVSEAAVQAGVAKWAELTCATFRQYDRQPDDLPSLRFIRGDGCYSYIGQGSATGTQEVSIGTGCTELGTVTHEIGHALGFYHEQSRPERDNYVTIQTQNIPGSYQAQFTRQSAGSAVNYGVEYDYGSVMHYDGYGFSSNGQRTVTTKDANYQSTIGQRDGPSFADVKQINSAYCNETCPEAKFECKNGGYADPKNCEVCRCPPGLGGKLCDQVQTSLSKICGDTDLVATFKSQDVSVDGDIDCYYRITAPAGRRVYVSFASIEFPSYTPCAESFAEVKYRANPLVTGARICGSNQPSSVTSEGTTMLILYKGGSTSQLSFSYRFEPATPVDTTDAPPTKPTTQKPGTLTSTTTRRSTSTTTTTQAPIDITTTEASTSTPTSPTGDCEWSECSADCGGCGTETRICDGETEMQYCATDACPGDACCRPFSFIVDGVCSRGETTDGGDGSDEWETETPESPLSNSLRQGEHTAISLLHHRTEGERRTIHIQPPHNSLRIELPMEKGAHAIGVNRIGGRASRRVQTALRVPVLEGSGDAPAS